MCSCLHLLFIILISVVLSSLMNSSQFYIFRIISDIIQWTDHGIFLQVLSVVAYPCDEVSQEALAFLSALLYAGNEKVQQRLQSLFQNDPHKSMEAFMSITQTLLIKAAACYKARYGRRSYWSQYPWVFSCLDKTVASFGFFRHSVLEALLSRTRQHYKLVGCNLPLWAAHIEL